MNNQDLRANVQAFSRVTSLDDDSSRYSHEEYNNSEEEDDHHSDSDSAEEFENVNITRQNSAIESYFGKDDIDHGSSLRSSPSLFHAGYRTPYAATWDQEMGYTLPLPVRAPISRRPVPSKAPTMQKLEDLPEDPNLVTWDKGDSANPQSVASGHYLLDRKDNSLTISRSNWPAYRRWTSTVLIAMYAFIAPMASTMVAPALGTLKEYFQLTSTVEEFLIMSIFLLAFAVGSFLWEPLSEVFGRVRVIQGANMIFLIFNTACGFAQTK